MPTDGIYASLQTAQGNLLSIVTLVAFPPLIIFIFVTFGAKYLRLDKVNFVEDSL